MAILRIALLHVAPEVGELEGNCRLIEQSVAFAATLGAEWIITPELCLTGYRFLNHLGSDWIRPAVDEWTTRIRKTAARFKVTIFLGHLERDNDSQLYNTVFVIGTDGLIIGKHRKVRVVKVAEDWANPGIEIEPINVASVRVGLLICADAYKPEVAWRLHERGAQLLVSCAAWRPGLYGPEDCWEQRSAETGSPLFVCNRTGVEDDFSFEDSESVIIKAGHRVLTHRSPHSSVMTFDWDTECHAVLWHSNLQLPPSCASAVGLR